MDYLKPENCNKTHCKSCIFHPVIENRIALSEERIEEITTYLVTAESSHVCHVTNKTCYGGLELQATIFHRLGILKEGTVDCLLETAKKHLEHEKQ